MPRLSDKWKEKIEQEEIFLESASYNGSFQGQVISSDRIAIFNEALADITLLETKMKDIQILLKRKPSKQMPRVRFAEKEH